MLDTPPPFRPTPLRSCPGTYSEAVRCATPTNHVGHALNRVGHTSKRVGHNLKRVEHTSKRIGHTLTLSPDSAALVSGDIFGICKVRNTPSCKVSDTPGSARNARMGVGHARMDVRHPPKACWTRPKVCWTHPRFFARLRCVRVRRHIRKL